jgi:thiol peroxidase
MAEERKGVVTFKGTPLTLVGPEIKSGQKAPEFQVSKTLVESVTLKSTAGKVRLIATVPSLDTPVCDTETRRFNTAAAQLPPGVALLTISMDLPFAQSRFCSTAGIDRLETLSDHRDASFGQNYGALIKEFRLLTRAVFVVGKDDLVKYVEYVSEITQHPDYEKALAAARTAAT